MGYNILYVCYYGTYCLLPPQNYSVLNVFKPNRSCFKIAVSIIKESRFIVQKNNLTPRSLVTDMRIIELREIVGWGTPLGVPQYCFDQTWGKWAIIEGDNFFFINREVALSGRIWSELPDSNADGCF